MLFRLSLTGNGAFRDVWLPNRPLHQRLFIARAGTSQEETGALPTMPFWLRTTTDQGILIFHGAHGPAHFSLPHELNIWHPLGSSRRTAMLCIWVCYIITLVDSMTTISSSSSERWLFLLLGAWSRPHQRTCQYKCINIPVGTQDLRHDCRISQCMLFARPLWSYMQLIVE